MAAVPPLIAREDARFELPSDEEVLSIIRGYWNARNLCEFDFGSASSETQDEEVIKDSWQREIIARLTKRAIATIREAQTIFLDAFHNNLQENSISSKIALNTHAQRAQFYLKMAYTFLGVNSGNIYQHQSKTKLRFNRFLKMQRQLQEVNLVIEAVLVSVYKEALYRERWSYEYDSAEASIIYTLRELNNSDFIERVRQDISSQRLISSSLTNLSGYLSNEITKRESKSLQQSIEATLLQELEDEQELALTTYPKRRESFFHSQRRVYGYLFAEEKRLVGYGAIPLASYQALSDIEPDVSSLALTYSESRVLVQPESLMRPMEAKQFLGALRAHEPVHSTQGALAAPSRQARMEVVLHHARDSHELLAKKSSKITKERINNAIEELKMALGKSTSRLQLLKGLIRKKEAIRKELDRNSDVQRADFDTLYRQKTTVNRGVVPLYENPMALMKSLEKKEQLWKMMPRPKPTFEYFCEHEFNSTEYLFFMSVREVLKALQHQLVTTSDLVGLGIFNEADEQHYNKATVEDKKRSVVILAVAKLILDIHNSKIADYHQGFPVDEWLGCESTAESNTPLSVLLESFSQINARLKANKSSSAHSATLEMWSHTLIEGVGALMRNGALPFDGIPINDCVKRPCFEINNFVLLRTMFLYYQDHLTSEALTKLVQVMFDYCSMRIKEKDIYGEHCDPSRFKLLNRYLLIIHRVTRNVIKEQVFIEEVKRTINTFGLSFTASIPRKVLTLFSFLFLGREGEFHFYRHNMNSTLLFEFAKVISQITKGELLSLSDDQDNSQVQEGRRIEYRRT